MFISLKQHMEGRPAQLTRELLRTVRMLLQGIELYAVRGEASDYAEFRAEIRTVGDSLTDQPDPAEVLKLAGRAVTALEGYNIRTSRHFQAQTSELHDTIALLARTISTIASANESSLARVQEIEKQLAAASMGGDPEAAISACLDALRDEVVRQREEAARQVAATKETLMRPRAAVEAPPAPHPRTDPVTGLPERSEAETAMLEAVAGRRRFYASIFILDRVDLVNARFGSEAGDDILAFYAAHLAASMTSRDRLFRWTGPAFLVLAERTESSTRVRDEISQYANRRLTRTISMGNRSIELPIGVNWTMFPGHEGESVQSLVRRIDAFIRSATESQPVSAAV